MKQKQIKSGQIIGIKGNQVSVRLEPNDIESCGSACRCNPLPLEDNPHGPRVWIPVENPALFKVGEIVKVEALLPSTYASIFLIFIIPLVFLLTGAILGSNSAKHFNLLEYKNVITGASSVVGLILAVILAISFDHFYRKKNKPFTIVDCCKHCPNENPHD